MPAEACKWIIAATTSSNCACHVLQNDVTLLLSSRYQKKWNSWLQTCRATENKKSEQFIGIHCVQANPQPTLLRLPEGDPSLRKVTFSFCTSCQIHPNPSKSIQIHHWMIYVFLGAKFRGHIEPQQLVPLSKAPNPTFKALAGDRPAKQASISTCSTKSSKDGGGR